MAGAALFCSRARRTRSHLTSHPECAQVLKEHGKALVAVLKAWDAPEATGECGRTEFRRAAQALGALGIASRIPSDVEWGGYTGGAPVEKGTPLFPRIAS